MSKFISSIKNDKVKYLKSLSRKKNRWKEKKYLTEGMRIVLQLIDNSENILEIYYSDKFMNISGSEELIDKAKNRGIELIRVTEEIIEYLTETESPQHIIALNKFSFYDLESIIKDRRRLILLDRIQDPGNLGTIIRASEAMGFNGILITKGTVDVYSSKVIRSTMGVEIPIVYYDSVVEAMNDLKKHGIRIISTSLKAEKMIYEVNISDNLAIVIGNEAQGISEYVEENSDVLVKIPMEGKAESLNVAIASSMIIYESLRQRKI